MIKLWVCSKEYPIRFFNGQKWVVGGRGGGRLQNSIFDNWKTAAAKTDRFGDATPKFP